VGSSCRTGSGQAVGYKEICSLVAQPGWKSVWNDDQKVPYAHKRDEWIGYDNTKSIKIKVCNISSFLSSHFFIHPSVF
jgi:hypothetical protein